MINFSNYYKFRNVRSLNTVLNVTLSHSELPHFLKDHRFGRDLRCSSMTTIPIIHNLMDEIRSNHRKEMLSNFLPTSQHSGKENGTKDEMPCERFMSAHMREYRNVTMIHSITPINTELPSWHKISTALSATYVIAALVMYSCPRV